MSAPVTERGRTAVRGRTAAIPAQRGFPWAVEGSAIAAPPAPTVDPGQSERRSVQQKTSPRRDERVRRAPGARTAAPAGRPQFVLLIMVLLAAGLVATLWLSTAAAADSYRLQDATAEARVLSEQAERLKQDVAVLASAPELARRAGELGMVPVRDPARLVVAADGNVDVVGQPRAAVAPPPPAPPAPPAGAQPPAAGTDGTVPQSAPDGTAQLASPDAEDVGGAAADGAAADGAAADGGDAVAEGTGQRAETQGTASQGMASQGTQAQGTQAQGTQAQGTQAQGTQAQGTQGQGASAGTSARAGGGRTDAG
jgi:hypothetical protein